MDFVELYYLLGVFMVCPLALVVPPEFLVVVIFIWVCVLSSYPAPWWGIA